MESTIKDIWENTNMSDQKEVNTSLKNTFMIIGPAVEKLWWLNLKVNVLYAIIAFCVVSCAFVANIFSVFNN